MLLGPRDASAESGKACSIGGTIPKADMTLTLAARTIGPALDRKTAVLFTVAGQLDPPGMPPKQTVTADIVAFDGFGKVHGSTKPQIVLNLPRPLNAAVPYQVFGRIDLKRGRYNIRVGAHDEFDQREEVGEEIEVAFNWNLALQHHCRADLPGLMLSREIQPCLKTPNPQIERRLAGDALLEWYQRQAWRRAR